MILWFGVIYLFIFNGHSYSYHIKSHLTRFQISRNFIWKMCFVIPLALYRKILKHIFGNISLLQNKTVSSRAFYMKITKINQISILELTRTNTTIYEFFVQLLPHNSWIVNNWSFPTYLVLFHHKITNLKSGSEKCQKN